MSTMSTHHVFASSCQACPALVDQKQRAPFEMAREERGEMSALLTALVSAINYVRMCARPMCTYTSLDLLYINISKHINTSVHAYIYIYMHIERWRVSRV